MAEPMRSGNPRMQFGHADDLGILGISRPIFESADVAQHEANKLLGCADQNAVSFDIGKSDFIQISGQRRETPVEIRLGNTTI